MFLFLFFLWFPDAAIYLYMYVNGAVALQCRHHCVCDAGCLAPGMQTQATARPRPHMHVRPDRWPVYSSSSPSQLPKQVIVQHLHRRFQIHSNHRRPSTTRHRRRATTHRDLNRCRFREATSAHRPTRLFCATTHPRRQRAASKPHRHRPANQPRRQR